MRGGTAPARPGRSPLLRLQAAIVTSALGVGCSGSGTSSSTVIARDSAGIEIVESSAPAWSPGEGISVETEPVLDLVAAGDGPDHEFYQVVDATRLSDGTVAVAESRAGTIRFYAPSGALTGSVGGAGEGPGEFARLVEIARMRGDSLFAYDQRSRRVTLYGPDRQLAAMVPLSGQPLAGILPIGDGFVARSADGETVDGDPGHVRWPGVVVRLDRDGTVRDTVARILGSESVRLDGEGGIIDARPLYGKSSHLAVGDGTIVVGDADAMQIRTYASDGSARRIVRVPEYDLGLGESLEIERAIRFDFNPNPANRELVDRLPIPPTRPAYVDLLVDAEGLVWAREHRGWFNTHIGSDPARWEVFGSEGAWLGTVDLPPRFDVFEIGSDYVLGRLSDEMDIERPQLLRLHRR